MASEDTEITLGAGKLLGLFFLLAAVCGVFFAIGYSLGKTSAREQALNDHAAETTQSASAGSSTPVAKPSAAVQGKQEPEPADTKPAEPTPDLTFYKAVKQSAPDTTPPSAEPEKPAATVAAKQTAAAVMTETKRPVPVETASATAPSVPATSATGDYIVQIAAVSHEEDAAALAGALRRKSYSASVVNSPGAKDKLYHVVVGPFASKQDADAMRLKLMAEGYNPIVKH